MDVAWVCLLAASALEPCWVIALEKSDNFRNIKWGTVAAVLVLTALYLMSVAVAGIGPGVCYALLAGIGSVAIVVAGYYVYREKITVRRIVFVAMIVTGVIGVRLAGGAA